MTPNNPFYHWQKMAEAERFAMWLIGQFLFRLVCRLRGHRWTYERGPYLMVPRFCERCSEREGQPLTGLTANTGTAYAFTSQGVRRLGGPPRSARDEVEEMDWPDRIGG